MKNISFRIPTSLKDIAKLLNERRSERYRHNVEAVRRLAEFYIRNTLVGRWSEISRGHAAEWSENDRLQFTREMRDECEACVEQMM